jgi:hypothetical protein
VRVVVVVVFIEGGDLRDVISIGKGPAWLQEDPSLPCVTSVRLYNNYRAL